MTTLSGHTTPDTAYVVDDYPYGFRLRCKIRYWLEYKPGKGFRFWSQTTNPKRPGEVWNKPKSSTFCRFGGAMVLADNGHVTWTGCHEYMGCSELVAWRDQYGSAMPEDGKKLLAAWITRTLMKNPNCDNDKCRHESGEVRVLPTGGDSNAILCMECYRQEIAFRYQRNRELSVDCAFDVPAWEDLKVYA